MIVAKPKTYRNKAYLDFIRSQPCMMCGAPPPSEAHHERRFGGGGTGLKPPDTHAVPLCRGCHTQRHNKGYAEYWGAMHVPRKIIYLLTDFMRLHWPPTGSKFASRETS